MSAKDLRIQPISTSDARRLVCAHHYSGKFVNNSQLHLGVFFNGRYEGAMQFGPPIDKRKLQGLVRDTAWNGFLELNRMAFSERLPRNSESRALAVAFRLIRQHYPHIEWVVSFADGAQCGDGTIYRAAGFVLTAIKRNDELWRAPNGAVFSSLSLTGTSKNEIARAEAIAGRPCFNGATSMTSFAQAGFKPIPGYQFRYMYFLNPAARARLTVPIVPFSEIAARGIGMYLGKPKASEVGDVARPAPQRRFDTDPDAPSHAE